MDCFVDGLRSEPGPVRTAAVEYAECGRGCPRCGANYRRNRNFCPDQYATADKHNPADQYADSYKHTDADADRDCDDDSDGYANFDAVNDADRCTDRNPAADIDADACADQSADQSARAPTACGGRKSHQQYIVAF